MNNIFSKSWLFTWTEKDYDIVIVEKSTFETKVWNTLEDVLLLKENSRRLWKTYKWPRTNYITNWAVEVISVKNILYSYKKIKIII